jgi:hypothetical protein
VIFSTEARARGLVRCDPREATLYAHTIAELASSELEHLYGFWLGRNRCEDGLLRLVVNWRVHRELLAFLVCVTSRYAERHTVSSPSTLVDAISDLALQITVEDARIDCAGAALTPNSNRALASIRRIDHLRQKFPYRPSEKILCDHLLNTCAWAIALQLSVSPEKSLRTDWSDVVAKRLGQLSEIMLESRPYSDMAILP